MATGKKRLNPKTGKLFKRGDVRDDGFKFVSYSGRIQKDGTIKENWTDPKKFMKATIRSNEKRKEYARTHKGKKRLNPKTGKPFKRRAVREDGFVFVNYKKTHILRNGFYGEDWRHPDKLLSTYMHYLMTNCRKRAKEYGLPINIDKDYLESIFPKSNQCPVLGISMKWGSRKGESPSLDRITPSKGYVKGNVMFLSHRANAMKSNATPAELKKFATWIKKTVR